MDGKKFFTLELAWELVRMTLKVLIYGKSMNNWDLDTNCFNILVQVHSVRLLKLLTIKINNKLL